MLDDINKLAGVTEHFGPSARKLVATVKEREAEALLLRECQKRLAADDLRGTVETLRPVERMFFHRRVAARRAAGESLAGLEWRALVDVRIEYGHWGCDVGVTQ
jgi:hypothetical protein